MKKSMLVAVLWMTAFSAFTQVGVLTGYKTFHAEGWKGGTQFADNYSFGVDYWFRLKKRRIEFTPELSFDRNSGNNTGTQETYRSLNFHFNTNIYLFNLEEDCDCPVWSKDGNFFSKGFFLQIAPGVERLKYDWTDSKGVTGEQVLFAPGGSIGAGLDVGLSDLITVTPFARYFLYGKSKWDYYAPTDGRDEAAIRQFNAGLKIGFRWAGK